MRFRYVPTLITIIVLASATAVISYYKPWENKSSDPEEKLEPQTPDNKGQNTMNEQLQTNKNPDLSTSADGMSKATAIIVTTNGKIKFKFYPNDAPKTVDRIIELINQEFYNGLTFHRIVPSFVVQGGDPEGNGTGGSGQNIEAEFNKRHHMEGTVAMARAADPDSADSQFFITLSPQPHLDNNYTVFGQVVEGMDVVKKLQPGDKMLAVIIE